MKITSHISFFVLSLLLMGSSTKEGDPPGNTVAEQAFSDLHNSVLVRLFAQQKLSGLEDERFPVSIAGLKSANTQLLFLSIGVPRFSLKHPDTIQISHVLRFLKAFRAYSKTHYPGLAFTPNPRSLKAALANNQTGWVYALEGSHLLRGDIAWIDSLYEAGVRMVGIAHWFHNHFLMLPHDTVNAERGYRDVVPSPLTSASVLSPKGRVLIENLIRKNILLDVSHLPEAAFWEVVEINKGRSPLIASHSNARALCDVPRNLDDRQIEAIAETGGIIGVSLHKPLLKENSMEVSLSEVTDHIRHLVKVAGGDHVALGTDLEGRIQTPNELRGIQNINLLFDDLQKSGMPDSTIRKIMHENVTRLILDR